MLLEYIDGIYRNMPTPVLVCRSDDNLEMIYLNSAARMLLAPTLAARQIESRERSCYLHEILTFERSDQFKGFVETLEAIRTVQEYRATVIAYGQKKIEVMLSASVAEMQGQSYFVIHLRERSGADDGGNLLATIFRMAYHIENVDEAVDKILAMAGASVHASRAYVFEDIGGGLTRNTYEWCAEGVEPMIHTLQNLRKEDYPYEMIVNARIAVFDDVRQIPGEAGDILTKQGIKSLAIIALYKGEEALGYLGFDDCESYREWKSGDVSLLGNVADIIVSMITRRNSEEEVYRSYGILQAISNNIDNLIYVVSISDYTLKFINEPMAAVCKMDIKDMIGKKCWQVLKKNKTGPCVFCPLHKLVAKDGTIDAQPYIREHRSENNGKWYLVRSAVIKWTDGEMVLLETGTEITHQKRYQEQLEVFASTDMMTNTFNREWGHRIIREIATDRRHAGRPLSLCFIDLDGLKHVNDTYGHDMGDEMITETIRAIRTCVRHNDILCRWGGDEFILLLVECDVKTAGRVMAKAERAVEAFNSEGKRPFSLAFSYGITDMTGITPDRVDALIAKADRLMYENKMKKRVGR